MARRKQRPISAKARVSRERRKSKRLGYSLTASRQKRERAQSKPYIEQAKSLSKFVPELRGLSKEKHLTPSQKARVTHFAKILKHADHLVPIPDKQAKKIKSRLYAPGVNAVQLRGTSDTAKAKAGKDLMVVSNGRNYIFWALDKKTVRSQSRMKKVGEQAFANQLPVEKLAELAEEAFASYDVKAVQLWSVNGLVGEKFDDLPAFVRYLEGAYSRYLPGAGTMNFHDPGKWVNGIAIQISTSKRVFGPQTVTQKKQQEMG